MAFFISILLSIVTYIVAAIYIEYKENNLRNYCIEIETIKYQIKLIEEMSAADEQALKLLSDSFLQFREEVNDKIETMQNEIVKIRVTIAQWVGGAFALSTTASILISIFVK